jgi:hypothetical protein
VGQAADPQARARLAGLGEAAASRAVRRIWENRHGVRRLSAYVMRMAEMEAMERNAAGTPAAESAASQGLLCLPPPLSARMFFFLNFFFGSLRGRSFFCFFFQLRCILCSELVLFLFRRTLQFWRILPADCPFTCGNWNVHLILCFSLLVLGDSRCSSSLLTYDFGSHCY